MLELNITVFFSMGFEVIIAPRSIAIVKALKREKKKR
jgi:hypothetical protein